MPLKHGCFFECTDFSDGSVYRLSLLRNCHVVGRATSDLRPRLVPVVALQLGINEITRTSSRREMNGGADSRKSDDGRSDYA
jgi:hypothetical protein